MKTVNAYAAQELGGKLKPFKYEPPILGSGQIDIKVHYCGICHSDLNMLNNDWGITQYPFVPGHEVVGEMVAVGKEVKKNLSLGDLVGLGWNSGFCMRCDQCIVGNHQHCKTLEETMVGNHGGFSSHVRSHWS